MDGADDSVDDGAVVVAEGEAADDSSGVFASATVGVRVFASATIASGIAALDYDPAPVVPDDVLLTVFLVLQTSSPASSFFSPSSAAADVDSAAAAYTMMSPQRRGRSRTRQFIGLANCSHRRGGRQAPGLAPAPEPCFRVLRF